MIWKLTIYAQQYRIYFEQVNQRALTLYVELCFRLAGESLNKLYDALRALLTGNSDSESGNIS